MLIKVILVNQTDDAEVGSSLFRLVLLMFWKQQAAFFFVRNEDLFLQQLHLKPLSRKAMGYCQTLLRVFTTALPGLIPSHKSSKLSANKPLLTSLAWKPWARNIGHWSLKGIWFSVSRLPVSALSSAVGPSRCRCVGILQGCRQLLNSCRKLWFPYYERTVYLWFLPFWLAGKRD